MPAPFDTLMSNATGGGGMPPGAGAQGPGMGRNPTTDLALSSMDSLTSGGGNANPTEAIQAVDKALDLAHQLVLKVIPQVTQWNSKLTKDLHTIARQILIAKMDLDSDSSEMAPPPGLMQLGSTAGLPPSGPAGGASGFGGGFA